MSNSIFLHNVLGLSGACLINFIYSSARQSYPPCFFQYPFHHPPLSLSFFPFLLLHPRQALASEILLDVQEVKQQLMRRRRLKRAGAVAAKGGLSAKSMIKAKSIAASILNMSENDLADIMDTDQVRLKCFGSTFCTNAKLGIHSRVNIPSTTVAAPFIDHLRLPIGNIQKFFPEFFGQQLCDSTRGDGSSISASCFQHLSRQSGLNVMH